MPLRTGLRAPTSALALITAATAVLVPTAGHARAVKVPGYRVAGVTALSDGVVHVRVGGAGQRIHIARIAPDAPVKPVVAVARRGVATGQQRTSQMCARARCLVGINGDFYYSSGRPAGAVVVGGEPWVTRRYDRPHLVITKDGGYRVGKVSIPISFRVRYPHELEDVDRLAGTDMFDDTVVETPADALNTKRESGSLVVYTRRRGPRTGTGSKGVELIGRITSDRKHLALRSTSTVRIVGMRERGNSKLGRDTVVLSATGAHANDLRRLWQDIQDGTARRWIRVRVGGPKGAKQVIGGRPELLRDGRVRVKAKDYFARASLARSIVGWDEHGTLFLVTIDDGNGAGGMSLARAARFMRALGATGAINLDGGGSTTFVRRGRVINRPRWGGERSVATALLIVRA